MKIVVDSNIVFSAILNTKSKIGQLLITGSKYFDFYTVHLLKEEIVKHEDKIREISGFTQEQFDKTFRLITNKLIFVEDILLSDNDLAKAIELVADIDQNDALFVALSNHLKANLWTGDKRLFNGLKKQSYSRVKTTDELYEIFLDKQLKKRRKNK